MSVHGCLSLVFYQFAFNSSAASLNKFLITVHADSKTKGEQAGDGGGRDGLK